MRRRNLKVSGILLLCIFVGLYVLITQNNNMNIEEPMNEDEETMVYKNLPGQPYHDKNKENEEEIIYDNPIETLNIEVLNENLRAYPAGSVMNTADYSQDMLDALFYTEELDQEMIERITGKSYKEDSDIPYSDLRYIRVLHMGYDKETHIGEMIVNKAIAEDVTEIFKELYDISYPIEKMILIDAYDADDIKSMKDNNSSAFNYRFIEGTTRRSVHSDGLAIDINPLYNPYVRTRDGKLEVLPESAAEHVDRTQDNMYYIRKDDPCYRAFISRGFTWGGEWKNSKDYQHFEKKPAE